MIRTLFQAPSTPGEVAADGIRVLGAISIIVAAVGWGPAAALSLAFAVIAMFSPRVLGLAPAFDILFGVATLAATWSSVTDLYLTARWWDIPMHFLTNGIWAALAYVVLVRLGVLADAATLPRPLLSTALTVTALGLSIAVLWEVFEWFGHTFIDSEIFVGYRDSIGDMVVGGFGSLLAGLGLRLLLGRVEVAEPQASPEVAG